MNIKSCLLMMVISVSATAQETDSHVNLSASQRHSYGITVAPLQPATEVTGAGYPARVVVPNSQLQVISALQNGLLESLAVAEGDRVTTGQVLARLQSPGLLALQRDLLQTLTQLNLARTNMDRDKQLLDEGIIPKRRYQESRSNWQALVTQKQQQEAALRISGMSDDAITRLMRSRQLSSTLDIVSPRDGIILEQMVILGQKVEVADPLFQVGELSPLWLEIHVPVDVASSVNVGDRISVPRLDIEGEIITIGRKIHDADQGTLVRAVVRDNIQQLRPGQFVQTRISHPSDEARSYLVPRKAVVRVDQQTIVFLESADGFNAVRVKVIGNRNGQQIIVTDTPIDGDVVTSGAVTLKAILTGAGGEG